MASRCSSGLLLSVIVIILLALEYSSAECDQGNLGTESQKDVLLQSNTKFLLGRKMLQELDGKKQVHIPGRNKHSPAELDNSFPEAQAGNNHVHAQRHSEKSIWNVAKRDDLHDESKAFLEAVDEVENLMRKDYKGSKGMARRKPPINNHEPKD